MTTSRVDQRVAQWRAAAAVIEEERHARLRGLTDPAAAREAADLLGLVDALPRKQGDVGLVEQQRIFARVRT